MTFAIVYENDASLVKMQDVIKLQQHTADILKNTVIVKKLDKSGDSRYKVLIVLLFYFISVSKYGSNSR